MSPSFEEEAPAERGEMRMPQIEDVALRRARCTKFVDTSRFYTPCYEAIEKAKMGYEVLIMVKGAGGIGKSMNIRHALEENHMEYTEYQDGITPANLPVLLYENRNKVLWIKDVASVLNNRATIDLIKAATETNTDEDHKYMPRMITLKKFGWALERTKIPKRFMYSGIIIFDYNYLSFKNYATDFAALKSRGEYIELSFTRNEMKKMMLMIAQEEWEKRVTNYLFDVTDKHRALNLRTQHDAFVEYLYSRDKNRNWKQSIEKAIVLKLTPNQHFVRSLMGNRPFKRGELKKALYHTEEYSELSESTMRRRIDSMLNREELIVVSNHEQNPVLKIKTA